MPQLKPVIWTLEEALAVVREVQPQTRAFGYHLALGGGVLNVGQSRKDLDLYFLPMDEENNTQDHTGMLQRLTTLWGPWVLISAEYPEGVNYLKVKFANGGKRIDAFIWKGKDE